MPVAIAMIGTFQCTPPVAPPGVTRKLRNRYTPEGEFDAEKKCKEHTKGVAIEQGSAKGQGNIAVIV